MNWSSVNQVCDACGYQMFHDTALVGSPGIQCCIASHCLTPPLLQLAILVSSQKSTALFPCLLLLLLFKELPCTDVLTTYYVLIPYLTTAHHHATLAPGNSEMWL